MFVRLVCVLALVAVGIEAQRNVNNLRRRPTRVNVRQRNLARNSTIDDGEIKLAFVIFRHGDRTSGPEEIKRFPSAHLNNSVFYPYGEKGLTNEGKRHAYNVGEYLRKRYDGFLSELYLPEEISIRTTDFARTKMTVLAALAGLYPPNRQQKWNYYLNWQPIPYDTRTVTEDDLSVYKSCPKYASIKTKVYDVPEVHERIEENREFLKNLSSNAGYEFKGTSDMYFFNNLVHSLENVGVKLPQWVQDAKPKITELTSLEFECEFYTPELKRMGGGVALGEFVEASRAIMSGDSSQPKVHLLSAHENSVAGFMAAAGVFTKPHQPSYGATFSLELRRNVTTSKYGVMAVYSAQPGGPGVQLPIPGCEGQTLCDFDTYLDLRKDIYISRDEYKKECGAQ
ncbi:venom acid phosphatase Acph-1-like [Aricia agestis]|uniref:venom acid phosphatase Acph-1-like n=1 Tax=Aricia agestis TaxID=91739 RepID=UPI001C202B45|nr:venom acid phosphatase Acph-1-like [Aricia agestis]